MTDMSPAAENGVQLRKIDPEIIGARLEVARLRKYPDSSVRAMARDLTEQHHISHQTYYWHERGERTPRMLVLRTYAEFFEIPLDYLLYGVGAEDYESEAREIARSKGRVLRIDILEGSRVMLSKSVNQPINLNKNHLPNFGGIRFIVKLMAEDLKNIAEGRIQLADVSGEKLPVPPGLSLSDDIAWWQIPDYDHSMAGQGDETFPPGTLCLIDMQADIEPGRFVVAFMASQNEPVVRRYVSDRRWAPGAKFRLEALNPETETIRVDTPSDCLLIARIRFSGSPR